MTEPVPGQTVRQRKRQQLYEMMTAAKDELTAAAADRNRAKARYEDAAAFHVATNAALAAWDKALQYADAARETPEEKK
jgi:hypothetical protein